MLVGAVAAVAFGLLANANPIDRNIAYRSPFLDVPKLGYDTRHLRKRIAKRQMVDVGTFTDEHYPTFFGADFSNSPFVWSGGINFSHGVASGDPLDTSVLLWVRALAIGGTPDQSVPVCVAFAIWDNAALQGTPADSGQLFTSWDVDFTVKVEATGLTPDTKYWYQFSDCTNNKTQSLVGQTRTLASPNTPAEQVNGGKPLSFAVFSCSNWPFGFFNAYAYAALNTTADVFIHLGDYIYEYKNLGYGDGTAIGRIVSTRELATLTDYRTRIALYRSDPGLLVAHQTRPWIAVWDDHDVADNTWKAGSADSNDTTLGCQFSPSGTCFTDRKLSAIRAYHEWMPIRQVDAGDKLRIWRNFQIGQLMDLTMLDTRQYDRDLTDVYYNTDFVNTVSSFPNRSIMGFAQEQWFFDTLDSSVARGAVWRIVGQQIVFTQLLFGTFFDLDAWDGYRANRNRVLSHIANNSISNVVLLSGDSHANWVSDLAFPNDTVTYNSTTGAGAIGVEFAGTAVTSPSPFGQGINSSASNVLSQELLGLNPDLQWTEGSFRGFFTIEVSAAMVNTTYFAMRNIQNANTDGFASANFIVRPGENRLERPISGGVIGAGAMRSGNTTTAVVGS